MPGDPSRPRAIGKVVKSTGHTDYVVQVYAQADVPDPPNGSRHSFTSLPAFRTQSIIN